MSHLALVRRDDFFYTRQWTRHLETRVIEELNEERLNGRWVAGRENNHDAIRSVRMTINLEFGKAFPYVFFVNNIARLKDRYKLFKELSEHPEFNYNQWTHTLRAPRNSWDRVGMVNPLALAYMLEGESHIPVMKLLFDPPEVGGTDGDALDEACIIDA